MGRFSEPALLILISLAAGDKHGYAMMDDIDAMQGVRLGPGTLYGAIAAVREATVRAIRVDERRRGCDGSGVSLRKPHDCGSLCPVRFRRSGLAGGCASSVLQCRWAVLSIAEIRPGKLPILAPLAVAVAGVQGTLGPCLVLTLIILHRVGTVMGISWVLMPNPLLAAAWILLALALLSAPGHIRLATV